MTPRISSKEMPQAAELVHAAASRLEQGTEAVRERNIRDRMGTLNDMGRREPLALLGGAVVAGFAISRFLKSSSSAPPGRLTMATPNYQRSVPEIIGDLFSQLTMLLRKEAQLARAEVSENMASLARGLVLIVGRAVLLIPALVILLQAAVAALTGAYGMASYWSALIVGGAALIIGIILLLIGISRLKLENVMPSKTVHQLQRDASVAKQQASQNNEPRRAA
ncbi:phage holin family protein [Bradyrhizobium sp. ORS 111]|uniref:phage holin family protein n=1 Tax=Bradyrhizobium sp. ORS 111 TaxID=1685958 RepID=UPI00388E4CDB